MKRRVLFLQLPLLENVPGDTTENPHLAAAGLKESARAAGEHRHHAFAGLTPAQERRDDAHLLRMLIRRRPHVIAATLYLWNIERTFALLARLRHHLPRLQVVAGGPEAAREHPFLWRDGTADVVVVGEGEPVFGAILRALRTGGQTDFVNVAWKTVRGHRWGRRPPPVLPLPEALPPSPRWPGPDAQGLAYLETARGCPFRCTYCRYHHTRTGVSRLAPAAIAARVASLRQRGAREIRLIDPAFNVRPDFDAVLDAVACANRDGRLRFFAEVNADRITAEQARKLVRAGFREVEVGVQSRHPAVLSAVRRPGTPRAVACGLRRLSAAGARITLDLMYGLPGQAAADVLRDLRWARRFPHTRVQCLRTLLLPGTHLRDTARQHGLQAEARPPYGVRASPTLDEAAMARIEHAAARLGLPDNPTRRFVGPRLPDLYREQVVLRPGAGGRYPPGIPGRTAKRAVILPGADLYARREDLRRVIRAALRNESHALWQFVLAPDTEEPLDLLDELHDEIRRGAEHLLDRQIRMVAGGRTAARRLFIRLSPKMRYDAGWRTAAEELLRGRFY